MRAMTSTKIDLGVFSSELHHANYRSDEILFVQSSLPLSLPTTIQSNATRVAHILQCVWRSRTSSNYCTSSSSSNNSACCRCCSCCCKQAKVLCQKLMGWLGSHTSHATPIPA
jgi:hypothetical protein